MEKCLVILTPSFYDPQIKRLKIGGLETYVKDLALVGQLAGRKVKVFQLVSRECKLQTIVDSNFEIVLWPSPREVWLKSVFQKVFESIYSKYNNQDTVFILATDQMGIRAKFDNVICIQHGVAFDIPGYMIGGFWKRAHSLQFLNKMLRCIKNVKRFYNTKHTVCVDYNYYNWFRTLGTIYPDYKMEVVPNYASKKISRDDFIRKINSRQEKKRILFARRFVDYRGAILFAEVVKRVLRSRNDVMFTFAGSGPLEDYLRSFFEGEEFVTFTSFSAENSVQFHVDYDIAVVPTIFSEGTSLSLCEAMAAGCFPIATHVGGMTNMILNGYNGFLVAPELTSLEVGLSMALDMGREQFDEISFHAYETATAAFSYERWQSDWKRILM